MRVCPVRDQVVVTKEKDMEKRSPGGIITISIDSMMVEGAVIAVGSGRVTMSGAVVPLEVQAGDRVRFNPSVAHEVQDDGKAVFILREDQLVCVFR